MALDFAHGSVAWLTTQALNTTIPVTGLGFAPKALRFYWVGLRSDSPTNANSQAVNERRGVGFASSTTSRATVGTTSLNASGNSDCGSIWSNTACVITVSAAGAVDGLLDISSFDANGFTLIVDDVVPQNITVFWEAWGGTDITNITIGAIAEPAATGTQTYTATGFEASPTKVTNQCIMFAGVQTVNASGVGQAQDSGLHVGFVAQSPVGGGTLAPDSVTVCGNSDDASGTMDTDGFNTSGFCVSMIVIAGGNPNAYAAFSNYGANSFTLNWVARATTNRRSIYMAIKGGDWAAGTAVIAGNTLNALSSFSVPYNVKGISVIGAMKPGSIVIPTPASTVQDRIGFGSGKSTTSRNSAAILDTDNVGTSEINTSINYSDVLVYPSTTGTLQTAYDLSVFTGTTVTFIVATAGGVANEEIYYLVFGDQGRKLAPVSIGHPFIC
jgi:hypothetical protein